MKHGVGHDMTMQSSLELRPPQLYAHPSAKTLWLVGAAVFWVIALLIAVTVPVLIGKEAIRIMAWWVVPIACWGAFRVGVVPFLRYRIHRWEITDKAIYTRTGWWSIHTRIVPINRVQNVDVDQGLFARFFGLAHVECSTAGDEITIGYLLKDHAQQIADELTLTMAADGTDAT